MNLLDLVQPTASLKKDKTKTKMKRYNMIFSELEIVSARSETKGLSVLLLGKLFVTFHLSVVIGSTFSPL